MIAATWKSDFSAERVKAYAWGLRDINPDDLEQAVALSIRSSRYPPTVSDLRTIVATLRLNHPGAGEALELVEAAVANNTTRRLPVPARRALDALGGSWAWKTTDVPSVLRGQFLRLYEEFSRTETQAIIRGSIEPPTAKEIERG